MPNIDIKFEIPQDLLTSAVKQMLLKTFEEPLYSTAAWKPGYTALKGAVDNLVATTDFSTLVQEAAARILPKMIEDATRNALKGMIKEAIKEGYRDGSFIGVPA